MPEELFMWHFLPFIFPLALLSFFSNILFSKTLNGISDIKYTVRMKTVHKFRWHLQYSTAVYNYLVSQFKIIILFTLFFMF